MTPKSELDFFFDMETTGFDIWSNSIIVLAFVVVKNKQIIAEYEYRMSPESIEKWSENSEGVHGISLSEALSYNAPKHALDAFISDLRKYDSDYYHGFWYHGVGRFDWRFILACMAKHDKQFELYRRFSERYVNSTLSMAKKKLSIKSYRLNSVCKHLGIALDHHDALSDARAAAQIYLRLYNGDQPGLFDIAN